MSMTEAASTFVPWLRALAKDGGKGVVGNIDARCLGRLADELDRLTRQLAEARAALRKIADGQPLYNGNWFIGIAKDALAQQVAYDEGGGAVAAVHPAAMGTTDERR